MSTTGRGQGPGRRNARPFPGQRRQVNDVPIDERIRDWRKRGRAFARLAQQYAFGDDDVSNEELAAAASLATMYFTLALDAEHFGDLPELEE